LINQSFCCSFAAQRLAIWLREKMVRYDTRFHLEARGRIEEKSRKIAKNSQKSRFKQKNHGIPKQKRLYLPRLGLHELD
jgi:hypothetical protein